MLGVGRPLADRVEPSVYSMTVNPVELLFEDTWEEK
jgi:hypothetical protein